MNFSSATAFGLDEAKVLLKVNSLPSDKILHRSKFKALQTTN